MSHCFKSYQSNLGLSFAQGLNERAKKKKKDCCLWSYKSNQTTLYSLKKKINLDYYLEKHIVSPCHLTPE